MPQFTGTTWGATPNTQGTPGGVVTYSISRGGADISHLTGNPGDVSVDWNRLIAYQDLSDAVRNAFEEWSSRGDIEFVEISDSGPNVGDDRIADIRIHFGPTPAGVTGLSTPPGPGLDAGDILITSDPSIGSDRNLLDGVLVREIGHAIGMDYLPDGAVSVMTPTVTLDRLQIDDIEGVQQLYGVQDNTVTPVLDMRPDQTDLTIQYAPAVLQVNGNALDNRIYVYSASTAILHGGAGDDRLNGNNGYDALVGGTGNDTLDGGRGRDTLWGGEGQDRLSAYGPGTELYGEEGDDTISGGGGDSTIEGGVGDDLIRVGGGRRDGNGQPEYNHAWGGDGNDTIEASHGFNFLYGDAGDDLLEGGSNADNIHGGAGNDTLIGNIGLDRLFGGQGDDLLMGGSGSGINNIGNGLFAGLGDDTLVGGRHDDRLYGGLGNDALDGEDRNDSLYGGAGEDTITGGEGDDLLQGDTQADIFVFADGHGADTITDFEALHPLEKIDLSAVSAIAGLADLTLGDATSGAATQVGADVVIDTGNGNAITLTGVSLSDLDASDFIF